MAGRISKKRLIRPDYHEKFILRRLGVQNLFCEGLECKIYFAKAKIDNDPFFKNECAPMARILYQAQRIEMSAPFS
ncbi:MAG: hypothetical protein DRR16_23515 [Candidatus Parabeggiatoa sp. nov. 3]|nr:MAG: hypothetical protein DRR00_26825 [Gammaproteobacteria bacterium]RKZ80630.1 MAG: hypothetical protein DRR16_23515 [Gammaproteobacteria bacterium]